MFITSIETWKKGRKLIYLNNEPAFVLYTGEVKEYGLSEDMELTAELYSRIEELTLLPRCKRRIMHMIDRRDKTEVQVRTKLREEYYPEEVIEEAVSAANRGRYLDDKRYALQYTYERSMYKSRRMISAELKSKGISDELIKNALEETRDNENELIKKQILKKKPDFESITYEEKQKLLGSVCRKGFDPDKVMRIYEELKRDGANAG